MDDGCGLRIYINYHENTVMLNNNNTSYSKNLSYANILFDYIMTLIFYSFSFFFEITFEFWNG